MAVKYPKRKLIILSKYKITPFYELNQNIELIFCEGNGEKYQLKFLRSAILNYKMLVVILKLRPDLITSFSTTMNLVCILISKISRIKVLCCEHNNYYFNFNNIVNKLTKTFFYKFSDHLTVLTQRDLRLYTTIKSNKISVLENPIVNNKPTNNSHDKQNIILAVGNYSRYYHKGFDNLIKIFSNIHEIIPDYELYIIGGGDNKTLRNLCFDYGVESKVVFTGLTKNIDQYYRISKLFVLTSRFEGFPMVLLEAMSNGLPCIAYDCFTGPSEIITNNKDGILIEDQNITKFENSVLNLIKDNSKLNELSKNALKRSQDFMVDKIIIKWEKIINKLICE